LKGVLPNLERLTIDSEQANSLRTGSKFTWSPGIFAMPAEGRRGLKPGNPRRDPGTSKCPPNMGSEHKTKNPGLSIMDVCGLSVERPMIFLPD